MNLNVIKKKYLQELTLENWIYGACFLLPVYLIRINFPIFPTNLWEIIIVIGFFWWFLDKKYAAEPKKILIKYKKYFFPVGMIFFGLIMGTLLNGSYRLGLGIIKGWFVFPFLFLFISSEALDSQKVKKLFQFFYFSALVVSIAAISYWLFGQMTFDARLKSFFNSPNYLAMYLSPAIIIGSVLFKENKPFYCISLPLILFSLYLTHSFAAWVALGVSVLAIFFLIKKGGKKIFLASGIILLVLFSFFAFELKTKKMEDLMSLDSRSSLTSRLMIWKTSEKLIQDNYLWGIGPGNFQNKYLEYQKFYPPYLEWAVPHPHNIFLAFWLYSGIIGFAGFLILLGFFFREFFAEQKSALKFMALGIMLVILIHGLFDTTYFKNDLAVFFWLAYLGMMKSGNKDEKKIREI